MLGKYLFFLLFVNVFSLKILIYQTVIGKSHVNFSGTLTDLLVKRGHTVVRQDIITILHKLIG